MKKNKNDLFTSAVALLCAFSFFCAGIAVYARRCDCVRGEVLRLHILADSDREEDQAVKCLVRDAVLEYTAPFFMQAKTPEEAAERVSEHEREIISVADAVLRENGMPYRASLRVKREYFDTRTYGDNTLPAGQYLALRICLGSGSGHNWWCVMFPPLCLPAACGETESGEYAIFSEDGKSVIQADEKYIIRFKIVEWLEMLREKRKNKIGNE